MKTWKEEENAPRKEEVEKGRRGAGGEPGEPEVEWRVGPERDRREPEASQRRRRRSQKLKEEAGEIRGHRPGERGGRR